MFEVDEIKGSRVAKGRLEAARLAVGSEKS